MKLGVIPFLTIGDPTFAESVALAKAYVAAGARHLELGIPTRDPLLDGPVVRMSHERSLANGFTLSQIPLFLTAVHRSGSISSCLMMSANSYLTSQDALLAALSPGDSILIPELTLATLRQLDQSPFQRIHQLTAFMSLDSNAQELSGLRLDAIYLAAVRRITGQADWNLLDLSTTIQRIRAKTAVPIVLGFGVKEPSQVTAAKQLGVDGLVIGSSLVMTHHEQNADAAVARYRSFAELDR